MFDAVRKIFGPDNGESSFHKNSLKGTLERPRPAVLDDPEYGFASELKALDAGIVSSTERLMAEILSTESSEVLMYGLDRIYYKENGKRYHLTEVDFKNVESYHHVINKFVLEYMGAKEYIADDSYLIEGQLHIQADPHSTPTIARIHVIAPPAVKYAMVSIFKKP